MFSTLEKDWNQNHQHFHLIYHQELTLGQNHLHISPETLILKDLLTITTLKRRGIIFIYVYIIFCIIYHGNTSLINMKITIGFYIKNMIHSMELRVTMLICIGLFMDILNRKCNIILIINW